jgi:hypothetical protein
MIFFHMQIRLFRDRPNGVSFFDAKRLAESEGLRLLSNPEINSSRVEIEKLVKPENFVLLCTGTLLAHPRRMGVFKDHVSYTDPVSRKRNVLEIPPEYRGIPGIALVSNDYEIRNSGSEVTYDPRSISVVRHFPLESGEYYLEKENGIPVAATTNYGKGRLSRFKGEMVGPVIRCVSRYVEDRRINYTLNPNPKPHTCSLSGDLFINTCPSGAFVVFAAK